MPQHFNNSQNLGNLTQLFKPINLRYITDCLINSAYTKSTHSQLRFCSCLRETSPKSEGAGARRHA